MWVWTLNWNEIRDDVLVGSCPMAPPDIDTLKAEAGITALLSVQHAECLTNHCINYRRHAAHGRRAGLAMLRCPMRDFDPPDQRRHLPRAVRGLHRLLAGGHRVYVHCTAGINRAPLTVLAYMTFVEGQPLDNAFGLLRHKRPEVFPTWEAWHGAREDLLRRHRAAIRRRLPGAVNGAEMDPATLARAEAEAIRAALVGDAA